MTQPYLEEVSGNAAAAIGTAAEAVRDYAQHASESVQHTAKQAAGQVRAGYQEAERFVRNRLGESLLVCFGVGLIAGVVIALSLRSRSAADETDRNVATGSELLDHQAEAAPSCVEGDSRPVIVGRRRRNPSANDQCVPLGDLGLVRGSGRHRLCRQDQVA